MRLLLTSDTQAEISNLDNCAVALEELIAAARKHRPDAIIHAGDLKEKYDPVHMAVVKFWIRAIKTIREEGFRVIVLMGNHDRLSQSVDAKNWLDVLRAAGAEAVSKPRVKDIGDGQVAFLPYTPDKAQEKEWARGLRKEISINPDMPSVLVFHTELENAVLNSAGIRGVGNTVADLMGKLDSGAGYDAGFGGHLHMHQEIANGVFYIGSPWCHDWGEANQTKGIVLADIKDGMILVKQLRTSIPGWYDTEYLESKGIEPESGAYIRSRVPVSTKKITEELLHEEERIRRTFPASKDLRLFVIPRVEQRKVEDISLSAASDRENVEKYVAATLPEAAGFVAGQVVAYLGGKLAGSAATGSLARIRWVSLEAQNVLSFSHVKIKYSGQGLVLIKGENRDWPDRSNGSGKSNLLGLLPVALFGTTLKGQKNDAWANENNKERADIALIFRDTKGRQVCVGRSRRPHAVTISVAGEDTSTGLSGKGKQETQGQIEEISGFDYNLLVNSVYIDQTIANGFVFGTLKARMDLMNKLLNLERFEAAGQSISRDAKEADEGKARLEQTLETQEEKKSELEEELKELRGLLKEDWAKQYKAAKIAVERERELKQSLMGAADTMKSLQEEADALDHDLSINESKSNALNNNLFALKALVEKERLLVEEGKCALCGSQTTQETRKTFEKHQRQAQAQTLELDALHIEEKALSVKVGKISKKIEDWKQDLADVDVALEKARAVMQQAEMGKKEEDQRNKAQQTKINKITQQLNELRRQLGKNRKELKELNIDIEMYEYARKAVHRSGMPLWLCVGMLPILNKAAEEYADLFNDGKVQIVFDIEDGEFTSRIINPTGSEKQEGQSVGESAMAGVVAAFALREVAPKSNLLILDEPGHGLDAEGAKQFARGIIKLAAKWPKTTILITTHNGIISGALEGEAQVWRIVKKKGVSQLIQAT